MPPDTVSESVSGGLLFNAKSGFQRIVLLAGLWVLSAPIIGALALSFDFGIVIDCELCPVAQ